ncbi:MAG: hypothetical protein M1831_004374 [Alyxoria varia]|nr:MAG: hypothetical protein M1831_004374 [Alyxoria varia]
MNDIRMSALKIDKLLSASIYIPFTDRLGDGKTQFTYPARNYIGGVNGKDGMGLVPALVGTLEGTTIFVASFDPDNQAYKELGGGVYSQGVNKVILPNPISGPGVEPAAFDSTFTTTTRPKYTEHTFHALINQPTILNNGFCQRNMYYFKETFTNPIMRNAEVTLYGPPAGAGPTSLAGIYKSDWNGGYSATGQTLGFNLQTCREAAAQFGPAAKV